ncbi:hypothetical protein M408DRAFT_13712 [Serendipita vermifera MAFF 305830]|uniref:Uncharacterized protein n=1 Tax=Serendipita vermifera MAFF 305830 TaxID=933852 RepID=A0A0C2X7N2_SERVB|nr:hypothetical protein M408DRAFT_13712 [Serendipita vermifera MAFF 305830]
MWCTRWFIPLFLFPVPTTRPYFLVLFMISALFHARPCPYCIAILIGLFLTTCSWSSVTPSAFEQASLSALNATELDVTWQMSSIALLSRCWCDFQRTPFFGYYNTTQWEEDSIKRAVEAANITSALESTASDHVQSSQSKNPPSHPEKLPWLRWKYDLRPHGIDLIVDLGWRRSD